MRLSGNSRTCKGEVNRQLLAHAESGVVTDYCDPAYSPTSIPTGVAAYVATSVSAILPLRLSDGFATIIMQWASYVIPVAPAR